MGLKVLYMTMAKKQKNNQPTNEREIHNHVKHAMIFDKMKREEVVICATAF